MRSPERARELGEVFTDPREVSAILDLLKDINYASRYLEPGCGSGNFLVEILRRKLTLVSRLPEVQLAIKSGQLKEFEIKSLLALASIYGIDISEENIGEARERMLDFFLERSQLLLGKKRPGDYFENCARFIIDNNIVLGDMLNAAENIEIYEFAELPSLRIKIRVFSYSDLMHPESEIFDDAPSLFGHVPFPIREESAMPFEQIGEKR